MMVAATINKIIQRYQVRFGVHGGDKVRETFKEELAYESGKLFITVFIGLVVWLPYIPHDSKLHQFPSLALVLRIGLSLLCISLILLRFTKTFHHRAPALLMIFVGYFYLATSFVTATSGTYASSYIGGYIFIMMMLIIGPFSFKFKAFFSISSVALFFLAGYLSGLDFKAAHINYSVTDLMVALVTSLSLNYIHNGLRYRTWGQRYELQEMVKKEQENIKTMSELARNAEEANKAKSNFLATMSHEIRTPLNAILGIAQVQMQKNDLPGEYVAALEKIHSSGSSLLGIINDILDLSKLETGKMEINSIEYDIPSLIHDAVQLNIVQIGSNPIEIMLDIDENLPSRLIGDELRIKQILNNLLSNAIKYTDNGYVKLSVSHSVCDKPDTAFAVMLRFIVEDTGQGMKPEDVEKLFSRYVRFNIEANRTTEGTGIGLNITRNLVELMDGKIEVESTYGKGTIFTVTIKQKAVVCEAIGHELSQQLRGFVFSGKKQSASLKILREVMPYGKVLIVDDVETNLYVAKGLMASYDLQIETAASGFAAIENVESGKTYDVIFMDHMMPLMDGIETTQKLRNMGYKGVIVALTANAIAGNAEMFKQNGFDDFISKPIVLRDLNAVLNMFVRDRHAGETSKGVKEAKGKKTEEYSQSKLLEIFRRDAEKARLTLLKTAASGDIKLFTTTAHAMKAALANIGESEMSQAAFALESAALSGDMEYIATHTENFVETLERLARELAPIESVYVDNANIAEDTSFLTEQLQIITAVCEDYDDEAAYAALDRLKEKTWKKETAETLEKIRDMLFLHSDFDSAGEQAKKMMDRK